MKLSTQVPTFNAGEPVISENKKTIVVIGNGMVGHRFCEKIVEYDVAQQFRYLTT